MRATHPTPGRTVPARRSVRVCAQARGPGASNLRQLGTSDLMVSSW